MLGICDSCGKIRKKNAGRGLCSACSSRKWRERHPERLIKPSADEIKTRFEKWLNLQVQRYLRSRAVRINENGSSRWIISDEVALELGRILYMAAIKQRNNPTFAAYRQEEDDKEDGKWLDRHLCQGLSHHKLRAGI